MSAEELDNDLVADVAEAAVEPGWLSEIARRLRSNVDPWQDMAFPAAVRTVSLAAQKLLDDNSNVEARIVDPPDSDRGSPHISFGNEQTPTGVKETRSWNPYKIINNTGMRARMVSPEIRAVIDPTVTLEEKAEVAMMVSDRGGDQARIVEDILDDHIDTLVSDATVLDRTPFRSSGVDLFVADFNPTEVTGVTDFDMGIGLEISARWVNPIGKPYVDAKFDRQAELEAEYDVPVDILIAAPNIRSSVRSRYEDETMLDLVNLPLQSAGFPIVIPDDADTQDQVEGTALVGDDYPVVEQGFEEMEEALGDVFRDFDVVRELDYRRQLSTVVNNFIEARVE